MSGAINRARLVFGPIEVEIGAGDAASSGEGRKGYRTAHALDVGQQHWEPQPLWRRFPAQRHAALLGARQ